MAKPSQNANLAMAAQRSRQWRMRHQALQIAAQLPENEADAMRILDFVHELVMYCGGTRLKPAGEMAKVRPLFPDEAG